MGKIRIVTDSTSDLSPELLERYDIRVLPLHVELGEAEYEDGVNISPDEIYAWADANKTTPKTAAPSVAEAIECYKQCLEDADELIVFSISGTMSACNQVLRMAAEEMEAEDRIHVIDSKNLSTGIGLLILEAADMAREGMDAEAIVFELKRLRPYVWASFVVDTLTYLHRGGRCSGLAALAGGMLRLHPRISVKDGKMQPEKKYRGRTERAIMDYVKDMDAALRNARRNRVFITHSGCSDELLGKVREYLEGLDRFDEILLTRAGSVISSHCGPATLGVLFIAGAAATDAR